jgi:hypothetical protein
MKLEHLNKDLYDIFQTIEFEDGGSIEITGTDRFSDDLRVELAINTGIEGQRQLWEIQINGVRADSLKSDLANRIELFEEHPLLWPYNQFQTNLYFGQPTKRPYELFADVYQLHIQETKKWFSLDKFINKDVSIIELCKSPAGLFASGPIKLLEAYKTKLEMHEMNPTIVGGHHPKHWRNNQWVEEKDQLKVLVIGDSYVVGETFEFSRA